MPSYSVIIIAYNVWVQPIAGDATNYIIHQLCQQSVIEKPDDSNSAATIVGRYPPPKTKALCFDILTLNLSLTLDLNIGLIRYSDKTPAVQKNCYLDR
jgi:hypothetical protein